MHMIKVPGSFHAGEILAVDVSPCNGLVVTGGKDGACNVWDRADLVSKSQLTQPTRDDFDALQPQSVLETGAAGIGSVTCLRFYRQEANKIKFVASYDDGQVWRFEMLPDGGYDKQLMFQHDTGVVEVTISMDDELLAASTYRNEIVVFDLRFDQQLDVLQVHAEKSAIKGLKFDNSHGKWLCSLADDKLISVISYELQWNRRSDATTRRLFKKDSYQKINKLITQNALNSNSRVRRLDFSKDDKLISVPNSNRGKMSLVNVLCNDSPIDQGYWKSWCSLVGHNFNCEVTKFNPNVYVNSNPGTVHSAQNPLTYESFYVIATAGSDRTLAIWNTSVDSPIIVAQHVTAATILDIAWSKDGTALFVTSLKGELLVFSFDDEELGKVRAAAPQKTPARDWAKEAAELQPPKTEPGTAGIPPAEADPKLEEQKVGAKNGKKRVAPLLVSGSGASGTKSVPAKSAPTRAVSSSMEFDAPSYAVSRTISQQAKRRPEDPEDPRKKFKKELQPVEFIGSVVVNPSSAFSNVRLSIPKIRRTWNHESPNDGSLYLNVRNGNGNESGPSKIQLFKRHMLSSEDSEKQIFCDFIPKRILLTTGGEGLFWAAATVEGTVVVYSDSGERILPPLVLGTPISFLESKGVHLMAVTCLGEMYAWDVKARRAVFEPTSLFPLLQPLVKPSLGRSAGGDDDDAAAAQEQELYENDLLARAENLTLCSITSGGVPIVTLSNGNGYIYDTQMCTWSLVSDSWWAFGSQYWDNTLIGTRANEGQNVIAMLEKHTNEEIIRKGKNKFFNKISKIMLMKEGFENLENIISINHLENKILIYRHLGDDKNFKYFLVVYVKKLIELNFVNRIYDIILNLKEAPQDYGHLINEIVMLNPKLSDFVNSV